MPLNIYERNTICNISSSAKIRTWKLRISNFVFIMYKCIILIVIISNL